MAIHFDTQGPAPDGFHVPSKDEWTALKNILVTTFWKANNNTTMETYLKMPMAGHRLYDSANVYGVGSYGFYWSSTPLNANYAYYLGFNSSSIYPQYDLDRSYGFSVRCLKNSPVIPTSSWTTLYDWSSIASGAWVFYNATDGLISVSGDWVTWYTIQDKNLWATTVFNQWDTLTDANCGYFYQRGNNYGFPHSWTVTTSSTQVDASTYWPWNYYSSSTFITWSNDWSSVQNNNLWGGVSQWMRYDPMRLHWAIQTFHRAPSWPSLKSYEEIIAMSADNAVAELNTYPSDYYDKFNSEWHIYTNYYRTLSDNWSTEHLWWDYYIYYYFDWTWDRGSWSLPS